MGLLDLLKQVAAELGVEIALRPPPADLSPLPPAIHDLYSITDGLELPFAEFLPAAQLHLTAASPRLGRGWVEFGWDGYFTHYLVASSPMQIQPIAAFDPELEDRPEGMYVSVRQLLEEEYAEYVGSDSHLADLHVVHVPRTAPLAQIAAAIKRAASLKSSEIVARLRAAPFVLAYVNAATAISVVRALHALGVTANLKEVRPRPAS
ncbi:MAG: hypothetical protein ABR517_06035 [Thermoanaerobaculia bacterium]